MGGANKLQIAKDHVKQAALETRRLMSDVQNQLLARGLRKMRKSKRKRSTKTSSSSSSSSGNGSGNGNDNGINNSSTEKNNIDTSKMTLRKSRNARRRQAVKRRQSESSASSAMPVQVKVRPTMPDNLRRKIIMGALYGSSASSSRTLACTSPAPITSSSQPSSLELPGVAPPSARPSVLKLPPLPPLVTIAAPPLQGSSASSSCGTSCTPSAPFALSSKVSSSELPTSAPATLAPPLPWARRTALRRVTFANQTPSTLEWS
mmetsp:Transcript_85042/g.214277  ORF Transcript_85042/g.214277 Transcript_85042/m.214277 type:complete len:262 (-) Transcript_85042:43-828(-)